MIAGRKSATVLSVCPKGVSPPWLSWNLGKMHAVSEEARPFFPTDSQKFLAAGSGPVDRLVHAFKGAPMNFDPHRLRVELQHLDWARPLKEEVIQDIADSAELVEYQPGQVVIQLDSEIHHVYLVVAG